MNKFEDKLNTAVITTKYVLEVRSEILNVYHHNEDGAWEFSGAEVDLDEEDYRVVSLEEIIKLDNSVLEISNLKLGLEAYRSNKTSNWKIRLIT